MDREIEALKKRISHLEKTNVDLQKQLELMHLTGNQNLLGILVFHDEKLLYHNQALMEITGYSSAEMGSWGLHDFYSIIHPPDFEALQKLKNNSFDKDNQIIFHHSFRIMHKEGHLLWIDQYEKTGTIQNQDYRLMYFMDITLQKQLESIMLNQEMKNKNIVNSLPMGIHMYHYTEDDLIFTGANPTADRILGVKHKQFIGKTIEEAFPKLAQSEIPSIYKTLALEGGLWDKELVEYEDNEIKGAFYVSAFQISPLNMAAVFMETTEKTRLQNTIRKNENQYRGLFEGSPDGIFLLSRDLNISIANRNGLKLMACSSKQEMTGKNFLEFISPEEQASFKKHLKSFLENPYTKPQEFRIQRADKRNFFSEIHLSAIEENGQINQIIAIVRDITERHITQMELERSEELFRGIFENAMDGMAVIDIKTKDVVLVNQQICKLTGFSEEEFLNKEVKELYPVDYQDIAMDSLQKQISGTLTIASNIPLLTKRGHTVFTDIASNKVIINETEYVIAIFRDITKRKQAEDSIKKNQEKLAAIFNHSPVMLMLVDSDLKITECNKTFYRQIGRSPEQTIGACIGKAVGCCHYQDKRGCDSNSPDCHNCELHRIISDTLHQLSGAKHRNIHIMLSENESADYAISTTPIKIDENWGVLISLEDITRQKKMEEGLIQRQKMDTIRVVAGGLAHDFNNMLTGIIGNISLAKIYFPNQDDVFKSLGEAESGAYRAQHLTEQLLSFAKGISPEKKVSSIEKLTKEALNFALSGSHIKYQLSIDEKINPVLIDEGQIHQVLNNLIINAQQAMAEDGFIHISIKNASFKDENELNLEGGDYVELKIRDTGKGIPKELQKKVFDPFFTTKASGSGLGLATSFSIITKHNGHISLESEPGKGSEFTIYLPAGIMNNPDQSQKAETDSIGGKCILIMDDEPDILNTTALQLEALGCQVIRAKNGKEALENFRKVMDENRKVDVALLDLTVKGGMGAIKTFEALKKIDPELKAIVTSGYSSDEHIANYAEYGFFGKLTKPFGLNEIKKALNQQKQG